MQTKSHMDGWDAKTSQETRFDLHKILKCVRADAAKSLAALRSEIGELRRAGGSDTRDRCLSRVDAMAIGTRPTAA